MSSLLCIFSQTFAGDVVDTRMTFAVSDNNLLAGAGDRIIPSPSAKIGADQNNTQFFDNINTRFSGFESLSHLVFYKKMDSFFPNIETEAAMALQLYLMQEGKDAGTIKVTDSGSYLRMVYYTHKADNLGFDITAFPISADRFRLGYTYLISWGGTSIFPGHLNTAVFEGSVPGLKLQYTGERFYVFFGGKTALLLNNENNENETNYGILGGAGLDVLDNLRVEAGSGFFQKGANPKSSVLGKPVNAYGGSAQVVYHHGGKIQSSVDFSLYKNDPSEIQQFFISEKYDNKFSFECAVETSQLRQTLENPDEVGTTVNQPAQAYGLKAKAKWKTWRVNGNIIYRDLAFILFNVPGISPFQDFPEKSEQSPEIFFSTGIDYHIPSLHLTTGLVFGLQNPATYKGLIDTETFGANPTAVKISEERVQVVRSATDRTILPVDDNGNPETVVPIRALKFTTKLDFSEMMALISELRFTVDDNGTRLLQDEDGLNVFAFEDPYILGFNVVLQSRF